MCSSDRSRVIRVASSFFLVGMGVVLMAGSATSAKDPKQVVGPGLLPPKQAKATLAAYKKAGWIALVEPDSRFRPGTIFAASKESFPQWVSSLESCGVPKEVLTPVINDSGAFQYSGESVYGAGAVLTIHGVTAGADFNKAQTATFEQSGAGASAIDIIKVGEWLRKNKSKFSEVCKNLLSQPGVYVAQESYRVKEGSYTLKDKKNVSLNLKGPNLMVIGLSAHAGAKITGESTLTLTSPVYTAVHKVVYANDVLELIEGRSRGELNIADGDIIDKLPY